MEQIATNNESSQTKTKAYQRKQPRSHNIHHQPRVHYGVIQRGNQTHCGGSGSEMGMVNAVVPHAELEDTAYQWAQEILEKSPTSIKMLKFAMNLTDDGMVGQQVFAGEATRLAYMTDEAKEGRDAFLEKRKPNFKKEYLP